MVQLFLTSLHSVKEYQEQLLLFLFICVSSTLCLCCICGFCCIIAYRTERMRERKRNRVELEAENIDPEDSFNEGFEQYGGGKIIFIDNNQHNANSDIICIEPTDSLSNPSSNSLINPSAPVTSQSSQSNQSSLTQFESQRCDTDNNKNNSSSGDNTHSNTSHINANVSQRQPTDISGIELVESANDMNNNKSISSKLKNGLKNVKTNNKNNKSNKNNSDKKFLESLISPMGDNNNDNNDNLLVNGADSIGNDVGIDNDDVKLSSLDNMDEIGICAICRDDLNGKVRELDCKHMFCIECIRQWEKEGNNLCPICRSDTCRSKYCYKKDLIKHRERQAAFVNALIRMNVERRRQRYELHGIVDEGIVINNNNNIHNSNNNNEQDEGVPDIPVVANMAGQLPLLN